MFDSKQTGFDPAWKPKTPQKPDHGPLERRRAVAWARLACICAVGSLATGLAGANGPLGWQLCTVHTDAAQRLACFDAWAQQAARLQPQQPIVDAGAAVPAAAPLAAAVGSADAAAAATTAAHAAPQPSEWSRFWELEAASDRGTFGIRGYKPISLGLTTADATNRLPDSPLPDHRASTALPYQNAETRIQLSVRTKLAQGLLTHGQESRRDSLWFAYSQQSYWQLFNGDLSRPFRTTDHEPELIYIHPLDVALPAGWRWRYAGLALNHQSNGQSLPLSRSWNRAILMAGAEQGSRWRLAIKWWQRLPERAADDDNPDIEHWLGRGEVTATWNVSATTTWQATLRHNLRASGMGSLRLEWLRRLGDDAANHFHSGLRLHAQLFSGYGDSLVDYNRRRTVLSLGLSLVDW